MTAKTMSQAQRVCTFICFLSTNVVAQTAQPATTQNATVHIVAEIRLLTGEPVRGMRAADFSLSSAGTPLSFQITRSMDPSPPSVLVVVSPFSGFHSLPNAADYLSSNVPSAIQSHYLMSVLGPHGEYVDLQPAHVALSMLKSATFPSESYAQAVSDLIKAKGPRAIVYMTNRQTNAPAELESAAKDAGALIYDVGGNEDKNYIFSGTLTNAGPRSAASWDGTAEKSIRTVYVVPSLQKAFKQMARASLGRYRLTVHVPAFVQAIQLQTKFWGDYQIEAYAYTDSGDPAPALTLSPSKR